MHKEGNTKMETYTTIAGDTWDIIAKRAYGDELKADHLMSERSNFSLLDFEVFPSGIAVSIPEIIEEDEDSADLPDWRQD